MSGSWIIFPGDVREQLKNLPDAWVQTVVTSPPYFGLRDYGVEGQLGLEKSPEEFTESLVDVFREVRRVLRDDGTLWLNLGDSYNAYNGNRGYAVGLSKNRHEIMPALPSGHGLTCKSMKAKDLIGIPWLVAFALRADGWYLRSDIIWSKPNPMPESVQDRPTRAHEYVFLLTKNPKYYYDSAAIRTPYAASTEKQFEQAYTGEATKDFTAAGAQNASDVKRRIVDKQRGQDKQVQRGANKRSVWHISPQPYRGAHFATFPEKLVEPCVLAGSKPGDYVMDPFTGSGTVGAVACRLDREFVGIELNPAYIELAEDRIRRAVA